MTIYLNIGSNCGDRLAHIERAVELICAQWPQASLRRAPYEESAPWGYVSPWHYLNLGIALDIDEPIEPIVILDATQRIERSISSMAHRNADGSYRDREIDIDIIAIDSIVLSTERLKLPHPRAAMRPFVVRPLAFLGYDLSLLGI